jgi:hypothetical protein
MFRWSCLSFLSYGVAAVLYSCCHRSKSFLRAKPVIQLVAISRHFVNPQSFIPVYVVLSLISILRCGGSSIQWLPRSKFIPESKASHSAGSNIQAFRKTPRFYTCLRGLVSHSYPRVWRQFYAVAATERSHF